MSAVHIGPNVAASASTTHHAAAMELATANLIAVTPPARINVVMTEVARRRDVFAAAAETSPFAAAPPDLAALRSVYQDLIAGRLV